MRDQFTHKLYVGATAKRKRWKVRVWNLLPMIKYKAVINFVMLCCVKWSIVCSWFSLFIGNTNSCRLKQIKCNELESYIIKFFGECHSPLVKDANPLEKKAIRVVFLCGMHTNILKLVQPYHNRKKAKNSKNYRWIRRKPLILHDQQIYGCKIVCAVISRIIFIELLFSTE